MKTLTALLLCAVLSAEAVKNKNREYRPSWFPCVREYRTPKYLRQNDRRYSAGFLSADGQSISHVEQNDFDASYDGVNWFHLLGVRCLRSLPSDMTQKGK